MTNVSYYDGWLGEVFTVGWSRNAKLMFHIPFTYLYRIFEYVRRIINSQENRKTVDADGPGESECSTQVLLSWETWTRTRNGGTRIRCFAN